MARLGAPYAALMRSWILDGMAVVAGAGALSNSHGAVARRFVLALDELSAIELSANVREVDAGIANTRELQSVSHITIAATTPNPNAHTSAVM